MGRETGRILPNASQTSKTYDQENRLAAITSSGQGPEEISEAYTYDGVGNKLTATDAQGRLTAYRYDSVYRLIGVESPTSIEPPVEPPKPPDGLHIPLAAAKQLATVIEQPSSQSYTYDPVGNRLTATDSTKTVEYQYNAANQMLQAGETTFNYDANGNRIEKNGPKGKVEYAYTYDDLLAKVDDAGQTKVTDYGYDGLNRRIFKASQGQVQVSYLYDGLEVLQEVAGADSERIMAYYRANNQIVSRQEHGGAADSPQAKQQQFYIYDGLGSVAALASATGTVTDRYQYDAFGEFSKTLNSEEDPEDVFNNSYTYTGRRFDSESGLYTFQFRQYDPGYRRLDQP